MENKTNKYLADRFLAVFRSNLWEDGESVSGPGSAKSSHAVKESLEALEFLVANHQVSSILDVPCGDFNWFSDFLCRHKHLRYTGIDIVEPLIARNKERFPFASFEVGDITSSVPTRMDVVFTKELFIHLTNADIFAALTNMKRSGATYLMASNHFGVENIELAENGGGHCRPLNLCNHPFSFRSPIWRNDFIGIWKFSDLDFTEPLQV